MIARVVRDASRRVAVARTRVPARLEHLFHDFEA